MLQWYPFDEMMTGWCPGRAHQVIWELRFYDDENIPEEVLETILDDMSDNCIPILHVS